MLGLAELPLAFKKRQNILLRPESPECHSCAFNGGPCSFYAAGDAGARVFHVFSAKAAVGAFAGAAVGGLPLESVERYLILPRPETPAVV